MKNKIDIQLPELNYKVMICLQENTTNNNNNVFRIEHQVKIRPAGSWFSGK